MSFELNVKKRQREVLLESALTESDRAKLQRLDDFEQAASKLLALDPSMQGILRERGDALSRGISGVAVRAATATELHPNCTALERFAKCSLPASMRLIGSTKHATYCIGFVLPSDLKIERLELRQTDVSSGEVTIRALAGFELTDRTDMETLLTKIVMSLQLASSSWTIVSWAAMQWLPPGEPGVTLASSK